jgi:hypothetical protein
MRIYFPLPGIFCPNFFLSDFPAPRFFLNLPLIVLAAASLSRYFAGNYPHLYPQGIIYIRRKFGF